WSPRQGWGKANSDWTTSETGRRNGSTACSGSPSRSTAPSRKPQPRRLGRGREPPLQRALLDCALKLLEGAHLDLAHPLTGYAELAGEILEGGRVILEPALDEDAPLTVVEQRHRLVEEIAADAEFLAIA